ncbi:uncharacterized protein LOC105284901 isoform X1 [Ooceraea biroi]|uniref:uncharacterized protein LOC105284901 isoform X1 n=1 Tax=Ooceraea biroi TaxID=2015173 RepID=UPI000971625D|nr:uncharacterized protein LOC105284901 isoform X1 [Ooceraea biroi]
MYASNSHQMCNVSRTTEQEQAKLQKIKELTNILKDTDKNLTICEEILATYVKKRLKRQEPHLQRPEQSTLITEATTMNMSYNQSFLHCYFSFVTKNTKQHVFLN